MKGGIKLESCKKIVLKALLLISFVFCIIMLYPNTAYAADDVKSSPLFKDSLVKSIEGFDTRSNASAGQSSAVQENTASVGNQSYAAAVMNNLVTTTYTCIGSYTCNYTCGTTCGTTCLSTCIGSYTCYSTCGTTCATTCGVTCYTTCGSSYTCGTTCSTTCANTCMYTCTGTYTCNVTCKGFTCDTATCKGATCYTTCKSTCVGSVTCLAWYTCANGYTCSTTCKTTCGTNCTTPGGGSGGSSSEISKQRLSGLDRYETSSQITKFGWRDGCSYAVLATGENYPDALGAVSLAKKYNAPILLTENNSLNSNTVDVLNTLGVKKVFIIGGVGVISSGVEDSLHSLNIETERLAGADRFETSVKVAESMGDCHEIFITVGDDFADALSIGSVAANKSAPILLTDRGELPGSVRDYINSHDIDKIYVIGCTELISENVTSGLSNVERIAGADKYERNIAIFERFSDVVNPNIVGIATGENFPDALSGSAFASLMSSPVILVGNNISDYTLNYIKNNLGSIHITFVFGGPGAVPENIINSLFQ